jgi:serine/threonine protein kinase/tetratricopeptide (TPR) repeat protein
LIFWSGGSRPRPGNPGIFEISSIHSFGSRVQEMSLTTFIEEINRRYRLLEILGSGGMGQVYRAEDRLTGQIVALKRVLLAGNPTANTDTHRQNVRLALAREFRTLAGLRHPHIISVLDYGFDADKQPFFTMELLPASQSLMEYGQDKSFSEQAVLIIEMLEALAYLHRRGITHRDLKPDNVRVVYGRVRVVDFGLSALSDQRTADVGTGGTLRYIAPEVIQGSRGREAADLYAAGMLMYELFSGKYPYPDASLAQILQAIVFMTPIVEDIPVVPKLQQLIAKLLHKKPADRPTNARDVIQTLMLSLRDTVELPEMGRLHESFLQAARFVGRENDMHRFEHALRILTEPAPADNKGGSAWLVGGETGVGKSRLLEELRIQAVTSGIMALRGEAPPGSALLTLWQDMARRLILEIPPTLAEAALLQRLVPDISRLLEKPITTDALPAESIPDERVVIALIDMLRRATQPILIILEDIQYTPQNRPMLQMLAEMTKTLPLMLVCTWNTDIAPELGQELPELLRVHLSRLSAAAVEDLAVSLLGAAGHRPELLELLQREANGNVFLITEIIRTLAEQAGDPDAIAEMDLPERVFPKGLPDIARRRLRRLPLDTHPLLRLAAVIGRKLDFALLREVDDETDYDEWLVQCADAAILEINDGEWRFTHDQMRDGVLEGLAETQIPYLNRLAAEAIEAVYPDHQEYILRLASHWRKANDAYKEAYYARLAGERMLHTSNFSAAQHHFERALELTLTMENPPFSRREIFTKLATAYYSLGEMKTAQDLLTRTLQAAQAQTPVDYETSIRALFQLSQICVTQGELGQARQHLDRALPMTKEVERVSLWIRVLWGLGDVAWRMGEYDDSEHYLRQSLAFAQQNHETIWTLDTLKSLGIASFKRGNLVEAENYYRECFEQAQKTGNLERAGMALNNLGVLHNRQRDYTIAQQHLLDALALLRKTGKQDFIAIALNNLGLAALQLNAWEDARKYIHDSVVIAYRLGNTPFVLENVVYYAALLLHLGDEDRALTLFALVQQHPMTQSYIEVRDTLYRVIQDVHLTPATVTAAWQPDTAPSLPEVVAAIVHDMRELA